MKIKLCVPTLLKYDLCIKLIESAELNTIKPEAYYIIDNGDNFKEFYDNSKLNFSNIEIIKSDINCLASSWNWFIKNLDGDLLIANDDLEFDSLVIQNFIEAKNKEDDPKIIMHSVDCLNAFALFRINSSIKNIVGLFDENFYPAYYEDNDMIYRIKSLGYYEKKLTGLSIKHEGSATLKEQRRLGINKDHDINFQKNAEYYVMKWGGRPLGEKYTTPYNNPDLTLKDWIKYDR